MKQRKTANMKSRWKDLSKRNKALVGTVTLRASRREALALNVDLGPSRIEKARKDGRGFVDHIRRTMIHHLKRELGRVPSFWIVVEDMDDRGRKRVQPHVHGVISIEPHEHSSLKVALMEVALDYYRPRAVQLTPLWNAEGWVDYCFKNLHKGDPACTGYTMTDPLRKIAARIYDGGRWPEIREKVRQTEIAAAALARAESVSSTLGPVSDGLAEPSTDHAAIMTGSEDYTPSPHFQELIRLANVSIFARLLGSQESAVRRRADGIAAQIEALGDDDNPRALNIRRELEHDRRDALARAGRIFEERIALMTGRRSPEAADFGVLFAGARGSRGVSVDGRPKSSQDSMGFQ